MGITTKVIKTEFAKAEESFEFCWVVLAEMKVRSQFSEGFAARLLEFQSQLATTIYRLQSVRDKIILEEKEYVRNKNAYNFEWFKAKMKLLSNFKSGIDNVVSLAKNLGDAYIHFFYRNDIELLNEHLSHQKIINHTASLGELGELEFIRNFKNMGTKMTIFHGITNILRYGDFSFFDLKTRRIVEIGELKTKKIDDQRIEFKLTLFDKKKIEEIQPAKNFPSELPKDKRERQLANITKFLSPKDKSPTIDKSLINESYSEQVNKLVKFCKINGIHIDQVSPGLNFTCIKFKKASLFSRTFLRDYEKQMNMDGETLRAAAIKLMKPSTKDNSIIVGGLLQSAHDEDHSIRGTIPVFWMPLSLEVLKSIYFKDVHVVSTFNPIHVIHDVEQLGFKVESKYNSNDQDSGDKKLRVIQNFDLFISYITSHLMTEAFVLDTIRATQDTEFYSKDMRIAVRPQQRM
ncbi:hypothetical protein HDC92_004329 [Pedobacter sp. AK017]|uniref:hypothetical protein n=1 Tax=Pedobacter sp. AK017 TaxID=2723073 RepID=UPI001617FA7D|nr:hypothetical protein [Pedobacter sp. AK017]MBB5440626.1 hypothetical protein [Pedobacter sp. AK017]